MVEGRAAGRRLRHMEFEEMRVNQGRMVMILAVARMHVLERRHRERQQQSYAGVQRGAGTYQ